MVIDWHGHNLMVVKKIIRFHPEAIKRTSIECKHIPVGHRFTGYLEPVASGRKTGKSIF